MKESEVYSQAKALAKPNPSRTFIRLDSLDTFKCIQNKVLISINPEEYETVAGKFFIGDSSYLDEMNRYNPAVHAVRHGVIVNQVDKFIFNEKGQEDHKTEIETKIGDEVFFPAIESTNCPLILCQDKYYLLMDYEVLYLAKRVIPYFDSANNTIIVDDYCYDVIMLNGYLLCSRYYEDVKQGIIIALEDKKLNKKYADVIYAGNPVEYRSKKVGSNEEIQVGDRILIQNAAAELMLEDSLHLFFDKKNQYRVVARKNVNAIV